jgi:hypothetical protein
VVCQILPFPYLNFYRRILSSAVRISNESRFEWADEVGFVGRGDENDLMGLLPKSIVMVSQLPPLWRYRREGRSCNALLWWSNPRPNIEVQLPAMWQLLANWSHTGQRKAGLCERRRVLYTPHMNSCLCVNWQCYVCVFVQGESSSVRRNAGKEGYMLSGVR